MKSLIIATGFAKKIRAKCPGMGYSEAFSTAMMLSSCKKGDRHVIESLLDNASCKLSEIITAYAQGDLVDLWGAKSQAKIRRPFLHDLKIAEGRLGGPLPPSLLDATLHSMVCAFIKKCNLDEYKSSDVLYIDQGDIVKLLFDFADNIAQNVSSWKGASGIVHPAGIGQRGRQVFHPMPGVVGVATGGSRPDTAELKNLVRIAAEAIVAVMGNPAPDTYVFLPSVVTLERGSIKAISAHVKSDSVDGVGKVVDYLQEVLHLYFSSINKK